MEEVKKINISEYTTYIGFFITILIYIGFNVLGQVFDYDGRFSKFSFVDWAMFIGTPIITAIIGSIAKSFLKKQGVNNGYKTGEVIKKHKEYMDLVAEDKEYKPLHWKQAIAKGSLKSFTLTSILSISMSFLLAILGIEFSIQKVLSMFITLGMWIAFGLMDMSAMYLFVTTEQIGWYNKEIEKIKSLRRKEDVNNQRRESLSNL